MLCSCYIKDGEGRVGRVIIAGRMRTGGTVKHDPPAGATGYLPVLEYVRCPTRSLLSDMQYTLSALCCVVTLSFTTNHRWLQMRRLVRPLAEKGKLLCDSALAITSATHRVGVLDTSSQTSPLSRQIVRRQKSVISQRSTFGKPSLACFF